MAPENFRVRRAHQGGEKRIRGVGGPRRLSATTKLHGISRQENVLQVKNCARKGNSRKLSLKKPNIDYSRRRRRERREIEPDCSRVYPRQLIADEGENSKGREVKGKGQKGGGGSGM